MKLFGTNQNSKARARKANQGAERARRNFLRLFSLGVCAAMTTTLLGNAFRFLRPRAATASDAVTPEGQWLSVAPVAELQSDQPVMRTVAVPRQAGWSSATEERVVFVLPQPEHRVLSARCTHEGCTIIWRADERNFLCPCHDSRFSADGKRLSGPAQYDLNTLPTRAEDGMLKVKVQPAANGDAGAHEMSHG